MKNLNELIERLSEASDNPQKFKENLENAITCRVQQRRAEREEKRKQLEENIRFYIIDGNNILLKKSDEIWIAQHLNLDVSDKGNSIVESLSAIFSSSVRYSTAIWELGRKALAPERYSHYDFIETYGGIKEWETGFQDALSNKINELTKRIAEEKEKKEYISKPIIHHLDSIFEEFKRKVLLSSPAFSTKDLDVDRLRAYYNENLIKLTFAQVHVTILPDNDQIILHFINNLSFNGLDITIYRFPNSTEKDEEKQTITRKIQGNDVRFMLSALGLTIHELNKVAFKVKIGDKYVEGRL